MIDNTASTTELWDTVRQALEDYVRPHPGSFKELQALDSLQSRMERMEEVVGAAQRLIDLLDYELPGPDGTIDYRRWRAIVVAADKARTRPQFPREEAHA